VCGICGFLLEERGSEQEAALDASVRRMADTLVHRGPDAGGSWVDAAQGVALGHRRLSILDLSPEGAQPMVSACGRYVLVYNGEIYNFRELRAELESRGHGFRGHSDTEVLVEAISLWGAEAAPERCDGMFALAVWDRREARLTLARDRLGKKPLYYGRCGGRFFFASELKALRAHPAFRPEIDRDALGLLVQYSYIPAPHSIFEGVHKLEPGTVLTLDPAKPAEELRPRAFWSAREVAERGVREPFRGSPGQAVERLHTLLLDAVGRRMVADVDLGALLSGGIDSSTVVALMQAQSSAPVRTFTVGFREARYDEAEHAEAVARHLGTEHTALTVTPRDALDAIPRLPQLYDEPFADTSQIPTYLVSQLARRHVTVALSGDGGDELFAGYNRYFRCLDRWRRLERVPAAARTGLARALERAARAGPAALGRLDRWAETLDANGIEDLFARMNARCRDAAEFVPGAGRPSTVLRDEGRWAQLPDPLQWMMYTDQAGHMIDDILVKVDRASMGVSLEVRNPLLDHRVVELAWQLPLDLKVNGGQRKWLLRRVLERYVPAELTERPKMGFGVPLGAWLRGPLRDWAEALLDERRLRESGFLEPAAVRRAWKQHLAGWWDRRFLLWNILTFQAWMDETG
jgi:asparagine synthase (glutamine-hydrolysing)